MSYRDTVRNLLCLGTANNAERKLLSVCASIASSISATKNQRVFILLSFLGE